MKTILYILAVCAMGGLLLCALSVYAGGSIIVGGSSPTHIVGAREGNVRGSLESGIPLTYTNYSAGRFTIWNTNQDVVIDNDSGLMWPRLASVNSLQLDWTNAISHCDNLETNGYSDWRLPSIEEFSRDVTYGSSTGLVDSTSPSLPTGHPFINIWDYGWWSSTTTGVPASAYTVWVPSGGVASETKVTVYYIWPCRGP